MNWQAAGIKGITIGLIPDGPIKFNLEVGMPTYSAKLKRTISREEAQKISANAYIGAVNEVMVGYESGRINPVFIPREIAAAMMLNINFELHGIGLATVTALNLARVSGSAKGGGILPR